MGLKLFMWVDFHDGAHFMTSPKCPLNPTVPKISKNSETPKSPKFHLKIPKVTSNGFQDRSVGPAKQVLEKSTDSNLSFEGSLTDDRGP